MAHKTFISYKYSESRFYRDQILDALGDDAVFYKGETSDSPNLTDTTTENIKNHLKQMIYDTTVTIIVLSPNMLQSNWIDWEISYSLKNISRDGRTSHTDGLLGVIPPFYGNYSWFISEINHPDGHVTVSYNEELTFPIMKANRGNQKPKVYACPDCQSIDKLSGSYLSYVKMEDFVNSPSRYIDNAYDKSLNADNNYDLTKLL